MTDEGWNRLDEFKNHLLAAFGIIVGAIVIVIIIGQVTSCEQKRHEAEITKYESLQ